MNSNHHNSFFIILLFYIVFPHLLRAEYIPQFSTAGFYAIPGTDRQVLSFNPAWRFSKGNNPLAHTKDFDDSSWQVVSLPHGIDLIPAEASGCVNYQGPVWYRKHFTPEQSWQNKRIILHFEAIMGKSQVYVNGQLLQTHFGGFLPVIVDITEQLQYNEDNVVAILADNSDDPSYPPGKAQDVLDYAYFGGIYRDCWIVVHNNVHITDPNAEHITASGGTFIHYDNVSQNNADVNVQTHLRNHTNKTFLGHIECIISTNGAEVSKSTTKVKINPDSTTQTNTQLHINKPTLWSPDNPNLYQLTIRLYNNKNRVVDGYMQQIGIRSIQFKGSDGLYINGEPYPQPLIGTNRHQEFAVIGNALPNSLHWRDAKKLRDAGLKVIRNAHYPQDPAFMDACDQLGLLVIVNTPGWQFWNNEPQFQKHVISDIRNMVRRDRNHPSVLMWEPILNETHYPDSFAYDAIKTVTQEFPFNNCYSACDATARGSDIFPIVYAHPSAVTQSETRPTFTREWGDYVDDWNSHNSPSRVSRAWGEIPMLIQANHYAKTPYSCTTYDALCQTTRQHVGGCFWHAFDHQRGYHPDPFYGGIMDMFRQPKYSYYMFQSQRPVQTNEASFQTGPMVYIAHEMTPFSPNDVTVFSNCPEVRLTFCQDGIQYTYIKSNDTPGMPSPPIIFENAYNFTQDKKLSGKKKQNQVWLLAQGLIDGQVVATHKVCPARRPSQLLLSIDDQGLPLTADGSDCVVVVASIADADGNVRRLSNEFVKFHVEGQGRLLAQADLLTNPTPIRWGTAPVILQSTLQPGIIRITASVLFQGSQKPLNAQIELTSIKPTIQAIYNTNEAALIDTNTPDNSLQTGFIPTNNNLRTQQIENAEKLKAVEQQQTYFGE